MAAQIRIDADSDAGTLAALQFAVNERQKALAETTSDAVIAITITILRSLKAATPKAKVTPSPTSYKVDDTGWTADIRGNPPRWRPISGRRIVKNVFPVNQMYGLKPPGKVYRVTLANTAVPWTATKNAGCYYIMCGSKDVAVKFAKSRVERILRKESGMAKYALGIAQARVSDRGELVPPSGGRPMRLAHAAAQMTVQTQGFASGTVGISFLDALKYSSPAAGEGAVTLAMQKAVNSTIGYINRVNEGKGIHQKVPSPFSPKASQIS